MKKLLIGGCLAIIILIAGCGRGYDFTLIDPSIKLKPLDADAYVEVYGVRPRRAYKPVATLYAEKAASNAFGRISTDNIMVVLKECARAAGCPAMMDVRIEDYYAMSQGLLPTIPAKRGYATGIIWMEPDPTIGVGQPKK
ncbi:MAG: hypothetical protein V3W11_12850 [bacterium]